MSIHISNGKEAALGGTRLVILCLELGFVWFIYFIFGLATSYDLPIWLTALLVVAVDRIVGAITSAAARRRRPLPPAPAPAIPQGSKEGEP